MSIKSAVRDGSFVKFLVGGVILLVLTGGSVYFVKKAQTAETQKDGDEEVVQVTNGGGLGNGAIVTIGSGDGESNPANPNDSSERPSTSALLPSDESDVVESSGRILPRTGPADAVPQVAMLGSVVYGVVYFITNKRR